MKRKKKMGHCKICKSILDDFEVNVCNDCWKSEVVANNSKKNGHDMLAAFNTTQRFKPSNKIYNRKGKNKFQGQA